MLCSVWQAKNLRENQKTKKTMIPKEWARSAGPILPEAWFFWFFWFSRKFLACDLERKSVFWFSRQFWPVTLSASRFSWLIYAKTKQTILLKGITEHCRAKHSIANQSSVP